MTYSAKLFLAILTAFMAFGSASAFLLQDLWNIKALSFELSMKLYAIVVSVVVLINLKLCDKSYVVKTAGVRTRLIMVMFFFFYLMSLLSALLLIPIPLLHAINLFVVVAPAFFLLFGSVRLARVSLFLVLLLGLATANRVYVASAFILYIWALNTIGRLNIIRNVLVFAFIMFGISSLKMGGGESLSGLTELAISVSSKFGAEWRDGIIMHDNFGNESIKRGQLSYAQSLLTVIPLHSAVGIISFEDYYANLPSTFLVRQSGLDSLGYTGIRIGIIWESYALFGMLGVVLYALIVGVLLRLSDYYHAYGDAFFVSAALFLASIYSIIGMINFIIGVYLSGLICVFLFIKLLRQIEQRILVSRSLVVN